MYPVPLQRAELRPGSLMIIPKRTGWTREGQIVYSTYSQSRGWHTLSTIRTHGTGGQCCGSYPRELCKEKLEETASWVVRDKASVENGMRNQNGGRGSRDQEEKGHGKS